MADRAISAEAARAAAALVEAAIQAIDEGRPAEARVLLADLLEKLRALKALKR